MRRLRLPSVIAGATLTVLLVGFGHQLRVAASVLVPLACLMITCFAGGLVAGRLAPHFLGLNGALGTALGYLGGFFGGRLGERLRRGVRARDHA